MSSYLTWQDSIVNTLPWAAKAKNMLAQYRKLKKSGGAKAWSIIYIEWSHGNSCYVIYAIMIPSNKYE